MKRYNYGLTEIVVDFGENLNTRYTITHMGNMGTSIRQVEDNCLEVLGFNPWYCLEQVYEHGCPDNFYKTIFIQE